MALFARIARALGVSTDVRHNGPALARVIEPRLPSYGLSVSPISGRAKVWLGAGVSRDFADADSAVAFIRANGGTPRNVGIVAYRENGRTVVRSALNFA